MRNAFAAAVTELAASDPRIVVLSGDIGNRLFDKFRSSSPGRFFDRWGRGVASGFQRPGRAEPHALMACVPPGAGRRLVPHCGTERASVGGAKERRR